MRAFGSYQGLKLPPSRLWDAQRGTGLLAATIGLPGCSGGWISAEGLFITNGFLARKRDAELRSKTLRVTIPRRLVDVTKDVLAAVPKNATDLERPSIASGKMLQTISLFTPRSPAT